MATSAASVQMKVVKGAGGTPDASLDCSTIFASFTPPIEFGQYDDETYRAKWRNINNAQGNTGGWQAEHVPPCSNFHVSGRDGATIPGCSNYSTDKALTWMVHDGQTHGEEHRILTEHMADFAKKNKPEGLPEKHATLSEWMDEYEKGAKRALKDSKDRTPDPTRDHDSLAQAAAECIRAKMDEFFNEEVGVGPDKKPRVDQNTLLRNGQAKGAAPPAPPPASTGPSAATQGSGLTGL